MSRADHSRGGLCCFQFLVSTQTGNCFLSTDALYCCADTLPCLFFAPRASLWELERSLFSASISRCDLERLVRSFRILYIYIFIYIYIYIYIYMSELIMLCVPVLCFLLLLTIN